MSKKIPERYARQLLKLYAPMVQTIKRGDEFVGVPFDVRSIFSPIKIVFPKKLGRLSAFPSGPYISGWHQFPPLSEALTKDKEILLRIDLKQPRKNIEENFKLLVTVLKKAADLSGKRGPKKDFVLRSQVYKLREKKCKFREIAEKVLPEEDLVSAIKRVQRFYREAKKMKGENISS